MSVQNISSVELLKGTGSESPGAWDTGQSGRGPPSAAFPQMPKCPDREQGLELTNTAGRRSTWNLTRLLLPRAASSGEETEAAGLFWRGKRGRKQLRCQVDFILERACELRFVFSHVPVFSTWKMNTPALGAGGSAGAQWLPGEQPSPLSLPCL